MLDCADNRRVLIDSKYVGQALQDPAALKPSMEAFKTVMFNVVYWLFLPFCMFCCIRRVPSPHASLMSSYSRRAQPSEPIKFAPFTPLAARGSGVDHC